MKNNKNYKKIGLALILSLSLLSSACSSINVDGQNPNDKTQDETKKESIKETESIKESESEKESVKETESIKESESKKESIRETESTKESEKETSKEKSNAKNHNGKYFDNAYSVKQVREWSEDPNYSGKKIAFLTFDDGPNNVITPKILETLKEKDVPATFFMLGSSINDNHKDVLIKMYEQGNSLATHSFSHDYDKLYPGRYPDANHILKEELKAIDRLKSYLGDDFYTSVFRYPGGHMSWNKEGLKQSDKLLADNDIHWIDWNTMTGDAQPKNLKQLGRPSTIQGVLDNFNESKTLTYNPDIAVILMHDAANKELTAQALPQLIDMLKDQGYEFGILE